MYDQEKKADAGKDRWDLLPMNQIQKVVKVLTDGAEKYGDNGWRKVEPERFFAAMMRHIYSWRYEQKKDKESGMNHMIHVICNAIFLAEYDDKIKAALHETLTEYALKHDKKCNGTICEECINNIAYVKPKEGGGLTGETGYKCLFNEPGYPCKTDCPKFKGRMK